MPQRAEVHRVPDLVGVDRAIKKVLRRIQYLEARQQQLFDLSRNRVNWVKEVVTVATELTDATQQLTKLVTALRSLKSKIGP